MTALPMNLLILKIAATWIPISGLLTRHQTQAIDNYPGLMTRCFGRSRQDRTKILFYLRFS
jgi:hypothetical protein